jgi:hypothetical protein
VRRREQEMLRSLGKKVVRMGRATVFVVGLSVILVMVFGVATTALAGNGPGDFFHLGQKNTVNRLSQLVGTTAGAMLRVDNDGSGTALDLRVGQGTDPSAKTVAPMKVDSQAKVTNLNADKLDGLDSTGFIQGKGNIYHGRRSLARFNGFDEVEVPGFGLVRGRCLTDTGGQLVWVNGSGQTQEASWFNKDGVAYSSIASGNLVVLTPATTQDYVVVLQVGSQGRTATITATQHVTSTDCNFSAQAVAQID